MFDRLPTPWGLVRGGVAPDHPNIKAVSRVYEKTAAHPEFRFFGNVELGRDITRAELARPLPRGDLRGRRADRPAHGHPRRGAAGQLGGHRVRGLVQRPSRLPRPRVRPLLRARRGDRQRQRGRSTWRGCSRSRATSWRPPTSPTTRSRCCADERDPGDRGARPPRARAGGVHQPGAARARRDDRRRRVRDARDVRARPAQPRRSLEGEDASITARKNVEILTGYAGARARGQAAAGSCCASSSRRWRSSATSAVDRHPDRAQRARRRRATGPCAPGPPSELETIDCGLVFRSIGYRGVPLEGLPFDERARRDPERRRARARRRAASRCPAST